MLGRTDSRSRLLVLLLVFVVAAFAVVGRLAYWQVLQRDDLTAQAVAQTTKQVSEPSRRGDIYDRSGTVVLATTVERDRLVGRREGPDAAAARGDRRRAGPHPDPRRHGRGRAPRQAADATRPTSSSPARSSRRSPTRSGPPSPTGRLTGISLEAEPLRVYPQAGGGRDSTLAAQLLGFVNREGTGQYGVEQAYQDDARRLAAGRGLPSATRAASRSPRPRPSSRRARPAQDLSA